MIITPDNVAAIRSLPDGSTAELVGNFTGVYLKARTWAKGVELDCTKAVLASWTLTNVNGITFINSTWTGGLAFTKCKATKLADATFRNAGPRWTDCEDVTVSNLDSDGAGIGLKFTRTKGIDISDLSITRWGEDGLQLFGVRDVVLQRAQFFLGRRAGVAHPDAIQVADQPDALSTNIRLWDIDIWAATQGAFLKTAPLSCEIEIRRMKVCASYSQALSVWGCKGTVDALTVTSMPGGAKPFIDRRNSSIVFTNSTIDGVPYS